MARRPRPQKFTTIVILDRKKLTKEYWEAKERRQGPI